MVTLWRGRFLEFGIEDLLGDAPRPGRTPLISPELTAILIVKTNQSMPTNPTAMLYAYDGQRDEHCEGLGG